MVTPGGRISDQPVSTPPRASETKQPSIDRARLDVGDDAVLAVEPEVRLEERPARQHALLDADAGPDQPGGRDPGSAEQEGTSGRHARQSACG